MKEIIMYSVEDRVFETKEEASAYEKAYKMDDIVRSIENEIEGEYPDGNTVVKNALISIRNNFAKLTKKDLQDMINYFSEKEKEIEEY